MQPVVSASSRNSMALREKRRAILIAAALALLFVALLVFARGPAATAVEASRIAPRNGVEPTLPLSAVQPGVIGYAKTVATGTVVTTFTVEVIDVLSNQNNPPLDGFMPSDNLILFRASGPVIDQAGGVVMGMSGSPVYLEDPADPGVYKIAGAVSYGFEWADQTIAFATPIEEMTPLMAFANMSSLLPKRPARYAAPDGGAIDVGGGRLLEEALVDDGTVQSPPAGTVCIRPLSGLVSISGMNPSGCGYKKLSAMLEAKGYAVTLAPQPRGVVRSATPTMEPGASLGVALATGDTTVAGIGTVTYVDGTKVLGFGHPMYWDGETNYPMTTAYVHTIVPSPKAGWKLASCLETTGTIVQDRWTGVAGKLGQKPVECTVTARAACVESGASTTRTYHLALGPMLYYPDLFLGLEDALVVNTNEMVFDAIRSGTAETSYTIKATTATGDDIVVSFSDTVFSEANIADMATAGLLGDLEDTLAGNGREDVTITDISYATTITAANRTSTIVDASLQGRRIAPSSTMTVTTSLVPHNSDTTVTVDTTLAIPAGFPAAADLTVIGGGMMSDGSGGWAATGATVSGACAAGPNAVSAALPDSVYEAKSTDLVVILQPLTGSSGDEEMPWLRGIVRAAPPEPIVKIVPTDRVLSGAVEKSTSSITMAGPSAVTYGGSARFSGTVSDLQDPYHFVALDERPKVELWMRRYGSTEATIAATTLGNLTTGAYSFSYVPTTSATFWTRFAGNGSLLDDLSSSKYVSVRAAVSLACSSYRARLGRTLSLSGGVRPVMPGRSAEIQLFSGTRWVRLALRTLDGSSNYACNWRPRRRGVYRLRTRFPGYQGYGANTSRTIRVTIY